jgi:lambda family phage portal protein
MGQQPTKKPPLLDRLITRISPRWALERDQARAALARSGGYVGGAYSQRFANWTPGVRDADGDITYDLREMRGRSRDLARNAPIARGAVGTMVTYVVGTGLSVQSRIDAELLGLSDDEASAKQKEFERYFNTWAASQFADVNQRQSFYEMQDLAERSELESGDVFALLVKSRAPSWPYRLAVQMVEADRVCNRGRAVDTDEMTQGIVRRNGVPYSVMIADRHPGRVIGLGQVNWREVPFYSPNGRRNVLHLMHMERPDQTRGVPWLASVLAKVKQLDRYTDAEVDAAVNAATMAVFAQMDPDAFDDLFNAEAQTAYIDNVKSQSGTLESGRVISTLPGETITSPTPGRPNPAFEGAFLAFNNEIAMGLGMPRDVLLKAFNASYSASRAALMDAWRTYKVRRFRKASRFCQPIYEEIIADGVAMGHISAPGFLVDPMIRAAWLGSFWSGDGPGALDPTKEATAAKLRIEMGQTTLPEEILAYDGGDWETKHRTSARVHAERVEAGLEAPITGQQQAPAAPAIPAPADMPDPEDDPEDDPEESDDDPGEDVDPTEPPTD